VDLNGFRHFRAPSGTSEYPTKNLQPEFKYSLLLLGSFRFYVRVSWKRQLFLILPVAIQTESIEVLQNRDQWFYLVNMVIIILYPWNEGTFLTSWVTIRFSSSLAMEGVKSAFKRNPVKSNKCKLRSLTNFRFNMRKVKCQNYKEVRRTMSRGCFRTNIATFVATFLQNS